MRRRALWIGVSVLGALGALAALWTVPDLEERPLVVDVHDVVPVRRGAPPDALRFAVAPASSEPGQPAALEPLGRRLGQLLGRPVRIVQRRREQELVDLLRAGDVAFAWIGPGAYLQARRDGIDLEVVAVPAAVAGAAGRSYTIVRSRSSIDSFEDLSGRPFAFSDPLSASGHYYPLEWAVDAGLDPRAFFRQATFTYAQSRSIEAVANDQVDGAAVDSVVWDAEVHRRPELAKRLRVVHESPPLPPSPVVVPRPSERDLSRRVRVALLDLARTPEGRDALRNQGVERFVAPPAGLYDEPRRRFDALMTQLEPER